MEGSSLQQLSGWGRFPREECHVFRPEKGRNPALILQSGLESNYIARGLGRSYGDAALNSGGGVFDLTRLNRMLAFDPGTRVLECEAGVSLAEILDVFVPRGYFLPVLPGTKFVTVAGAIANDIHGKNHHVDGTFSRFVRELRLLKADGEIVTCSPEEQSDAFWATVGGIGLTGIILSAKIALREIETAYFVVDYVQAHDIDEALDTMTESDDKYEYSVAWVDCLAKDSHLGRSILMRGNHARRSDLPGSVSEMLRIKPKLQKTIPVDFPAFALNPWSIKAFNTLFYKFHRTKEHRLIDYDSYFCPLDSIHNWNRMYGKRGFTQYQATIPFENRNGLVELLEALSNASSASFLAVLKRMGPVGKGLLSYPCEGYTLTLDIPMRHDPVAFLHGLDKKVLNHGGRLYCAKDAVAEPATYAAMYPRLGEFREIKACLDPDNVFSSSMSRRLAIV